MNVIVEDLAEETILKIFYYNLRYSIQNATQTNTDIKNCINALAYSPYIGRYVPQLKDKHFREFIYKKTKHSSYRIIYYISESTNTIYVLSVLNCKQDFIKFLTLHNYFKNYFNF